MQFHQRGPFCGHRIVSLPTVVFLLVLSGSATGLPFRCHHSTVNSLLVANCQAQRHKAVPHVDPSVQALLLNFNAFSAILNSSFPPLKSLRMLSLGKQQGGSLLVGERAFRNVSNITFLDLGGNANLTLHRDAFSGLTKLEVLLLDVDGLDEEVLENGYFRDLVSLKRLDLSGNHLRRLRPDPTFQGLKRLTVLQLKLNKIGAVCGDDLQHLRGRHLALLDLSSNRLLSRPACANPFRDITLGTLDISSNSWTVTKAEQFFTAIRGTRIQNLKMQHPGAMGSGFGFSNLKGVSASTFSGLCSSGVVSFDMSHGFLNKLVSFAFSGFPDLQILLLRSNQINRIQNGTFAGLSELRVLDLSDNFLGELYRDALQPLTSSPLFHLILKSNHIGAVQHNALEKLNSLQILDLQDNALSRVPPGKLPALLYLKLGQNRIKDAWGIADLSKNLTHLDLSSNRLSELGSLWGHLGKIPNLLFLNLSRNQLAKCFRVEKGPRQLRELDLSHNNLENIWKADRCVDVFQHLEKLAVLNLSSNALRDLPGSLFRGLVSLQTLDLSANLLLRIPEQVFQSLTSLRTLSLRRNPLTTLSPPAFRPLVQLRSLDLGELSLFCQCNLVHFQGWVQDRTATVRGAETTLRCIRTSPDFAELSLTTFLKNKC
ncbi:toll-like receptor 5 [Elgaria multicarinata webbii]|uniref:toll-like receptor 5 n=1 Tax=Elgaria multicarinata webbii TaxID=159646 RepID=UPI002FCCEFBB